MRTAAIFAAAAAFLPSVLAQAVVTVTGANDGQTGMRRELTELQRDEDAFNLYVLALDRYKRADTNNLLSYYQISGIHGLPCQDYSGVSGNSAAQNQGGCGYCTHSSSLFPSWHRAYLMLYEQGFLAQVQGVIDDFSGNPTYQAKFAALLPGFRIAYWDWAAGSGGVPSIMTQTTVTVPSETGGTKTIDNPFYQYKYQVFNTATTGGSPWSSWPQTLRYPTSSSSNAVSDENAMVSTMDGQFRNVQSLVYKMLLNCKLYEEMADDSASTSSQDCAAGLESIHGQIHVLIGGDQGHMSWLDEAGFDPAFWLHHANVDRLLSLWQIAQGKKWLVSGQSGNPTWTTTAQQTVDGSFGLTPFYKDANSQTFWTSNDLPDWCALGYNYPETSGCLNTDQSTLINTINTLYGKDAVTPPVVSSTKSSSMVAPTTMSSVVSQPASSAPAGVSSSAPAGVPSSAPAGVSSSAPAGVSSSAPNKGGHPTASSSAPAPSSSDKHEQPSPSEEGHGGSASSAAGYGGGYGHIPSVSVPGYGSLPTDSSLPSDLSSLLTPLGRTWDWTANIVAERMGLGGTYVVYLFLGEVPSDSNSWGTAKNLVGTWSVFSSKRMTAKSGHLVSGAVSLTATLVEQIMAGNLKGLVSGLVQPFLKKKLTWAVRKCDGTVVPNDQVPGLQVMIVSSKVQPPSSMNKAPVWQSASAEDEITSGQAGGSKSNPYTSSSNSGSWDMGGVSTGSDGQNAKNAYVGNAKSPVQPESGSSGSLTYASCIPQVTYVYEYVHV